LKDFLFKPLAKTHLNITYKKHTNKGVQHG
jgi:hypothetical protein